MVNPCCACCHRQFRPCPRTPDQSYCSSPDCQRARRRLWQQAKRLDDPDYRENQAHAHRAWAARSPGYWRDYRASHPDYAMRNREQQRERRRQVGEIAVANMDALTPCEPLRSGVYRMTPVAGRVANMDAITVEIRLLSVI